MPLTDKWRELRVPLAASVGVHALVLTLFYLPLMVTGGSVTGPNGQVPVTVVPTAEETHVKDGTAVVLSLSDGSLVMRPARRSKASLKALLSEVDASNLNLAGFGDSARGDEIW